MSLLPHTESLEALANYVPSMCVLASALLGFFPPGLLFPQMAARVASSSKSRFGRKRTGDVTPATGEESNGPETPEPRTEKQAKLSA